MSEHPAIDPSDLDHCLCRDRFSLSKSIKRWQSKKLSQAQVAQLAERIQKSRQAVENRLQYVPNIEFPDLPVCDHTDEILKALQEHQVLVVSGETGSGKTTQLPKICLLAGRGVRGMICHTQPRRIAARSVAERIAEECHRTLGQEVGYSVRFHDHTDSRTLVKLMTDGILLAETRRDPYLSEYDTLIIDEAHERSLNTDFLLGYLKWLLPKRRDLKLIITSATIDTKRFAEHFNAPVFEVPGRSYPVECRYRPLNRDDQSSRDISVGMLDAIEELARHGPGDILVFMSGEREIRDSARFLSQSTTNRFEILPLYGRLSAREQAQIFKSHQQRRIILATNVAETSLTVPGIRYVIDTGLARISRYSLRSKIQRLPIEPISQASANQRAGRCGRVAPGICIRLYDEDDFLSRPEFTEAELLRTNLAAVILQMKLLKLGEIESFPFLEPPEAKAVRSGIRLLQELNALDRSEKLTAIGQAMARLPIDPRFARILIEASRQACVTEACILVSALSIQDPRERPNDKQQQADAKHAAYQDVRSDFISLLNLWRAFQQEKKQRSKSGLRQYCQKQFLSFMRMCEWEDIHRQILRIATRELGYRLNHEPADYRAIHSAILPGMLSQIGFKQEGNEYLGARNLKFHIHPSSVLRKKSPKWIVASEQVETSRVFARNVAGIEPEWIEACASHLLKKSHTEPYWSKKQGRALIRERVTVFGLTIVQGRAVSLSPIDAPLARELFIRQALVEQDFVSNAPFYEHNQKKLEQAGYVQHKQRRVDLMVDAEWLFDFYDQIIPEDVVDARRFEKWRKQAEHKSPRLLFLPEDRLLTASKEQLDRTLFPDELAVGQMRLPLRYRFEPGAIDDGVTLVVQLSQLNQISDKDLDWLVPGFCRDKVIQLLRTLPKSERRRLGPIPDASDTFLTQHTAGSTSLLDALERFLRQQLASSTVPSLDVARVDDHLRMNIRLMQDQRVLAESRDLSALQQKYASSAEKSFQKKAQSWSPASTQKVETDWVFGKLDIEKTTDREGERITSYPALVAVDQGVHLGEFDTLQSAHASHRAGLLKLLEIKLKSDLKYLRKHLRQLSKLDVILLKLPKHPNETSDPGIASVVDQIIDCVIEAQFLQQPERIRSQQDFEILLDRRSNLIETANRASALLEKILLQYSQLNSALSQNQIQHESKRDMQQQLSRLVFHGFLKQTPMEQLEQYTRYLQGIERRIERVQQSPAKDLQLLAEQSKFENPYWTFVKKQKNSIADIQQHAFRWMLEEFRISLFSQPLKTRMPVSAKRMTQAWANHIQKL